MEEQSQVQKSTLNISAEVFYRRYRNLASLWESKYSDQFDAIVILYGNQDDRAITIKVSALHIWLLGYEFVDSIIIFTKKSCIIIASQKKYHFKSKLENKDINIHFLIKQSQGNEKLLLEAIEIIKSETSDSPKLALLQKEKQYGSLITEYEQSTSDMTIVELSPFIQDVLSLKEQEELDFIKTSAKISSHFAQRLIEEIEHLIDEEIDQKHSQISQKIDTLLNTDPEAKLIQKRFDADRQFLDFSYNPLVQSGGHYDLRPQAEPDERNLSHDVIICSIGMKYHEYNSNIVRSLFIDPTQVVKTAYSALLEVQNLVISNLKPSVKLCSIHEKAVKLINEKYPELLNKFGTNFGNGIGLEFRESNLFINSKNENLCNEGQVFNIAISLTNISSNKEEYSMMISDTVIVKSNGVEVITGSVSKKYEDVSYSLQDDDVPEPVKEEKKPRAERQKIQDSNTGRRTRGKNFNQFFKPGAQQDNQNEELVTKRKEHQKQLLENKQQELEERLQSGNFKSGNKQTSQLKLEQLKSYRSPNELPKEARKNQIYVDSKQDSVLLPINGVHVPFHVSVLKNVSKHEEGKTASLRFNFHVPGTGSSLANIQFPENMPSYIRELTYRSSDIKKIGENLKKIKELQKKVKTKYQEQIDNEELAEQEPLQVIKGKRPSLQDLKLRPNFSGRKTHGTLEAHLNGFRYSSNKGEKLDINYRNIKYAFFQSCEGEMIVLIHLHLYNPIMIGRKKYSDVQFYTEAGVQTEDLDFRKRALNDLDEIDQEERERALRKKLDREFEMFVKAVEVIAKDQIQFETPYRELGFYGTPFRSQVYIQPTINCLVNLTEVPFFVQPLDEIEIAHFERIQFGLKNFDLTFIFKNYEKQVARISAVPIEYLESLRNWLDKMDILYSETVMNLNWQNIMNHIKLDYEKFVEDGGWAFLQDEENDEEEDDMDENDSEFDASQEEDLVDEEEEDNSDFSGEEEDEDVVDDSEFSGEADEDLSEEGLDWDELEELAEKKDNERENKQRYNHPVEQQRKRR